MTNREFILDMYGDDEEAGQWLDVLEEQGILHAEYVDPETYAKWKADGCPDWYERHGNSMEPHWR